MNFTSDIIVSEKTSFAVMQEILKDKKKLNNLESGLSKVAKIATHQKINIKLDDGEASNKPLEESRMPSQNQSDWLSKQGPTNKPLELEILKSFYSIVYDSEISPKENFTDELQFKLSKGSDSDIDFAVDAYERLEGAEKAALAVSLIESGDISEKLPLVVLKNMDIILQTNINLDDRRRIHAEIMKSNQLNNTQKIQLHQKIINTVDDANELSLFGIDQF